MREGRVTAVFPSVQELAERFRRDYGDPRNHGWRVRLYHRFGYYAPEAWYESTADRLITPGCRWIDVGGGKSVFPHNPRLSQELSARCAVLLGIDPSENLCENHVVHRQVRSTIEAFRTDETFDLATFRMVVEHLENPAPVMESLTRLIRPGGHVVIYTPNRWSAVSIAASLVPNAWHSFFTRLLWNTHDEDVFPTWYRMNTRKRLRQWFASGGFTEEAFVYLDNCITFHRSWAACWLELSMWKLFRAVGMSYPENDLLGVYRKSE